MLVQGCHNNQNQLQHQQHQSPAVNSTSAPQTSQDNSQQPPHPPLSPTSPDRNILTSSHPIAKPIHSSLVLSDAIASSSSWNNCNLLISDSANNNNSHNRNQPARPPPPQPPPTVPTATTPNANVRQQLQINNPIHLIASPQQHCSESESTLLGEFDLAATLRNKVDLVESSRNKVDPQKVSLRKKVVDRVGPFVAPNISQSPSPNTSCNTKLIPVEKNESAEVVEGSKVSVNLVSGGGGLVHSHSVSQFGKMSDAYLSGVKPEMLKNSNLPKGPISAPNTPEALRRQHQQTHLHLNRGHGGQLADKKDKMEYNQMMMRSLSERETRPLSYHGRSGSICLEHRMEIQPNSVNKRHIMSTGARSRKESVLLNRRSMPGPYIENRFRDKFDVSDLDTNLPRIDLEAIETHLRQARDEERKRRSDREEIRRRLALESDGEMIEKPRKHNLHSRLQSSMNLQICFMNETASDSESPNSDNETNKTQQQQPASLPCLKAQSFENVGGGGGGGEGPSGGASSEDFFAKQARLQAEARQALAQAKEMARLQMTQDRDRRTHSPITEMVRNSLEKVGVGLPPDRRRVSRQLLTEMNVTQLQVIVNDLHSHIEKLNETLVSMLLERDDLHMEQDSMLVDIEDLTRYLAAKYNSPHQSLPLISASQSILGRK